MSERGIWEIQGERSIWEILGTAPTRNVKEIKRVYALQSKLCHPEEEPEKFEELQRAYKSALQYAKNAKNEQPVYFAEPLPVKVAEETPSSYDYSFINNEVQGTVLKEILWEAEQIYWHFYTRNTPEAWKFVLEGDEYRDLLQYSFYRAELIKVICRYNEITEPAVWDYFVKQLADDGMELSEFLGKSGREFILEAKAVYADGRPEQKPEGSEKKIRKEILSRLAAAFHLPWAQVPEWRYAHEYLIFCRKRRDSDAGDSVEQIFNKKERNRRKESFRCIMKLLGFLLLILMILLRITYRFNGRNNTGDTLEDLRRQSEKTQIINKIIRDMDQEELESFLKSVYGETYEETYEEMQKAMAEELLREAAPQIVDEGAKAETEADAEETDET